MKTLPSIQGLNLFLYVREGIVLFEGMDLYSSLKRMEKERI